MGFHCSTERSQLKVYFHFPALAIPLPLVAYGDCPAVRFRFVPLSSTIPSVVRGIWFRFLTPLVGRCTGVLIPLLFVALPFILSLARNQIFPACLKSAISHYIEDIKSSVFH